MSETTTPKKWEDLPNAAHIAEVIKDCSYTPVYIKFPQWGDTEKPSYVAAKDKIKELGRMDEWLAVTSILLKNTGNFMVSSAIESCTALIAWDDLASLYLAPIDQLQLSLQLLPETDRIHHAVELLLPFKQLKEVVLTKEDAPA